MINYRYLFLSLTALFICSIDITAHAQNAAPDYYITIKNDTVACNLKEDFLTEKLLYHKPGAQGYTPLAVDSVTEYHFHRIVPKFVKRILPGGKTEFVSFLVSGKINLYVRNINYGEYFSGQYFASKGNGDLLEIKSTAITTTSKKQQKEYLYGLFADLPQLFEQFKNMDNYSFDLIQRYIVLYNKLKTTNP